ncbi:hypothetical protein [Sagittula sp. S175]|uniref:hypothetical protein n=1 Tax=Sagittula sp. S175 TaxID=3415129 RepID=UPI003C7C79C0
MFRVFLTVAAVLAVLLAAPLRASAETVAYKCNVRGAGEYDWIQPLIFIAHDRLSGRVVVSDAMILAFNDGQPVEGRLDVDNARRTTFTWKVKVILQASPVTLSYRGTYIKGSGEFSVLGSIPGETMTRGGVCQVDRLGD